MKLLDNFDANYKWCTMVYVSLRLYCLHAEMFDSMEVFRFPALKIRTSLNCTQLTRREYTWPAYMYAWHCMAMMTVISHETCTKCLSSVHNMQFKINIWLLCAHILSAAQVQWHHAKLKSNSYQYLLFIWILRLKYLIISGWYNYAS